MVSFDYPYKKEKGVVFIVLTLYHPVGAKKVFGGSKSRTIKNFDLLKGGFNLGE